ncbi:MAG: SdpI family protein [Clostridia bacterium]|nr:SdpI family protein [Clostridia bacterium]
MLKQHKWKLLVSSLVILLPMIVGLCIWNILPNVIPIHWDINGNPDGFAGKAIAVFAVPGGMLALHWLCVLASVFLDPKSKNTVSSKAFGLVIWITPIINLVVCALVFAYALGLAINIGFVMSLLVGVMFIVIGNYLPKCKQSYTMGIKLPWTLHDEENWNKTHRLGGIVWVICGIAMLATSWLGNFWVLVGVLLAAIIIPTIYSYVLYRKKQKENQDK